MFSYGHIRYEVINDFYRAAAVEKSNDYLRLKGKGDTMWSDRPIQSILAYGDTEYS